MPVITESAITRGDTTLAGRGVRSRGLLDPQIVRRAIGDAVRKLNPRTMMKNPVMFVVEAGAVMTTVLAVRDVVSGSGVAGFSLQITL